MIYRTLEISDCFRSQDRDSDQNATINSNDTEQTKNKYFVRYETGMGLRQRRARARHSQNRTPKIAHADGRVRDGEKKERNLLLGNEEIAP